MSRRARSARLISHKTRVPVADNSGIIEAECIGVKGGKSACGPGETIKVRAVRMTPEARKYAKGTYDAIVIRSRGRSSDASGHPISFDDNAVVMVNAAGDPLGTRVFGPVCRTVDHKKIMSMAKVVL